MPESPSRPASHAGRHLAVLLLSVLGGLPGAVQAQTFDRLFTTASERAKLDQAREEFRAPAPEPAPVMVQEAPAAEGPKGPVVSQIWVSGLVIRGRGLDTSWINGEQIQPDEVTPEGIRVQPQGQPQNSVRISLPESTAPLVLRPGQKIDLATGQVLDGYQQQPQDGGENVLEGLTGTADEPTGAGIEPLASPVVTGGG